jgi:hypothetical protein
VRVGRKTGHGGEKHRSKDQRASERPDSAWLHGGVEDVKDRQFSRCPEIIFRRNGQVRNEM